MNKSFQSLIGSVGKKLLRIGPIRESCLKKKCNAGSWKDSWGHYKLLQLENTIIEEPCGIGWFGMGSRRIKEKDVLIKEENDEIADLELADESDDENLKPSSSTHEEDVEFDVECL